MVHFMVRKEGRQEPEWSSDYSFLIPLSGTVKLFLKKKILELLQNCPDFISGQELSERFGVSRTAVWKVIRQLEAEGYVIQAVRNKGYRLTAQPDLLTEETIQNQIQYGMGGTAACRIFRDRFNQRSGKKAG